MYLGRCLCSAAVGAKDRRVVVNHPYEPMGRHGLPAHGEVELSLRHICSTSSQDCNTIGLIRINTSF